jgi:hypothetical protein
MKEGQKIVLEAPFDLIGLNMKETEYRQFLKSYLERLDA